MNPLVVAGNEGCPKLTECKGVADELKEFDCVNADVDGPPNIDGLDCGGPNKGCPDDWPALVFKIGACSPNEPSVDGCPNDEGCSDFEPSGPNDGVLDDGPDNEG